MQDIRREVGSGIGKSHEEGGTDGESPIREREGETDRDAERDGKSGREKQAEGVRQRGKYIGSFLSRILSLWFSGAFPSLEKLSLFSVFLSLFLSVSAPSSTFFVSSLSLFLFFLLLFPSFYLSFSLCLKFSLLPSTSCTFSPYFHPSFDGPHSLLSSSRLIQPLFSQDASLQGLLHQNGTGIERGRELGIMLGICHFCCVDFLRQCRWKNEKLLQDIFVGEI